MTEDERDERKQAEADIEEDLELDEQESGEVRGGDGTTAIPMPTYLGRPPLKKGSTGG